MDLPKADLLQMYKKMVAIREFEESLAEAVAGGTLPGFVHLGVARRRSWWAWPHPFVQLTGSPAPTASTG